MQIINGGEYEGRGYDCMYDANQAMSHQDRYDKESDLVGFVGRVCEGTYEDFDAMLYFSGNDVNRLQFEKGELYFLALDKTYGELRKDAVYNISTFKNCKSKKKCREGVVTYKGTPYHIRAYALEDTNKAWDEAIIIALAKAL